jgi:hypothetical protein
MTYQRIQRTIIAPITALAFAFAIAAHGQEPATATQDSATQDSAARAAKHEAEVAFLRTTEPGEGQEARQKVILDLVTADNQVVKGKPYAADTSTETVQALADGNRIVNRSVSKFYRDSQGRTRREQTFGNVDPSNSSPHEMKVFIDDPVSSTSYVVDPGEKTVRPMSRSKKLIDEHEAGSNSHHLMVKILDEHEAGNGMPHPILPKLDEKRDIVKEDLGKRTIEGVECTGTQQTITIPVGEVGNERPISIVTETWYAPAIAAVVQSSTSDPRFGTTTYQLRNVLLSEQQRQLFEPPSDYRVEGAKQ